MLPSTLIFSITSYFLNACPQSGHVCPRIPRNCTIDCATNCPDRPREIVSSIGIRIAATHRRHRYLRRRWEKIVSDAVAQRPDKKFDYVILRSEQVCLVSAAQWTP